MSAYYLAYGSDHGQPLIDALAEGRRYEALRLAVEAGEDIDEGYLVRARKFERYLKDGRVEDLNGAPVDGS